MEKYSALIIDFVNSRMLEVERRNLIQVYVSDLIDNLNTVFSVSVKQHPQHAKKATRRWQSFPRYRILLYAA